MHSIGVARLGGRRTDRVPNWQKIDIDQCGGSQGERGIGRIGGYVANWVIRPADKIAKSQLQFEINKKRTKEN